MTTVHRAYGKLRDIIERRGGTMTFTTRHFSSGGIFHFIY
jgi:hypothetical protein